MRARTMTMALLISAHGKLGDVRPHGVFSQIEFHVGASLAALAVIGELERVGIGHEIGRQEKSSGEFALTAEVTLGARIETIEEGVIAVEYVVAVVKKIHHEAAIG